MNLINQKVKHKVFGKGIIISLNAKHIKIDFGIKGIKMFVYPDVFKKFIVLNDTTLQVALMKKLNDTDQAEEGEYKKIKTVFNKKGEDYTVERKNFFSTKKKSYNIEDGFDQGYNVKFLEKQYILTYKQVEEKFGIKISGFGRGINRTSSTIVLISSVDRKKAGFVYHDHWSIDGDYIYSGEGKKGNQQMSFGNRAIINAENDCKNIHLFVKFLPVEYYTIRGCLD